MDDVRDFVEETSNDVITRPVHNLDNMTEEEKKELTPKEYFDILKAKKQTINDEELLKLHENALDLLNKYKITNQRKGALKIIFHLQCLEKERAVVAAGVNTFVYRDDIEEYIDNISKDTVKIIELENYEREIPDEIVSVIDRVGSLFDQLYVVFTDYTGKAERQVAKERREKDPILFGTFQKRERGNNSVVDRFYFLGDWEDEYCDLTLDKLMAEFKDAKQRDITREIFTPEDVEEFKSQLEAIEEQSNGRLWVTSNTIRTTTNFGSDEEKQQEPEKKSLWKNVRTFFNRSK